MGKKRTFDMGGMCRALGLGLVVVFLAPAAPAQDVPPDEQAKTSYSIGYQVGNDFREQDVEINPEMVLQGVQDALAGERQLMSPPEMRRALADLQRRATSARERRTRAKAERNLTEGKAFLEENAKRDGVTALPSGLQYSVLRDGSGARPTKKDAVVVHYRGTFIDGTEFDNTRSGGKAVSLRFEGMIEGWREALVLMREGAAWRLFVPPALAYGDRRVGDIGPNSVLIFELELLAVQPGE